MSDNVKQNLFFVLAILLLLLGMNPSKLQTALLLLGSCSVLAFLYYLTKVRIKNMLSFFRRR